MEITLRGTFTDLEIFQNLCMGEGDQWGKVSEVFTIASEIAYCARTEFL